MTQRFRADRDPIEEFADEVLVACPACGKMATARLVPLVEPAHHGPMVAQVEGRLVCAHCGHNARRPAFVRANGGPVDPVFQQPVWLQRPCAGETLWAYNARHLDALEQYVRAPLRERRPDPDGGWRNAAWTSRLPQWLSSAKNREAVLQCIARIRRECLGDRG